MFARESFAGKSFYTIFSCSWNLFRLYILTLLCLSAVAYSSAVMSEQASERIFFSSLSLTLSLTCLLLLFSAGAFRFISFEWARALYCLLSSKKIRLSHLFNFNNINLKMLVESWVLRAVDDISLYPGLSVHRRRCWYRSSPIRVSERGAFSLVRVHRYYCCSFSCLYFQ